MTPGTNAPATPPRPSVGQMILTDFEKVLLGLVAAAPSVLPVVVHSTRGILIANASEALFASVVQQFTPKPGA